MVNNKLAQVDVFTAQATWFGVTFKEDKPRVQSAINDLVNRGEYPKRLFS